MIKLPEFFHSNYQVGKNSSLTGWVRSKEEATKIINLWNAEYNSSFVHWYKDQTSKTAGEPRIVWCAPKGGPLIQPGVSECNKVLVCHHGGQKYKPCMHMKGNCPKEEGHHDAYLPRKRLCVQSTKKTGCPAKIKMRTWTLYEDYAIDPQTISKGKKELAMKKFKIYLKENTARSSSVIIMELPLPSQHVGHDLSLKSLMTKRIHPLVKDKIHSLVRAGVATVATMRPLVESFVHEELVPQHELATPDPMDTSFFPTRKVLQNHIVRAKRRYSPEDQESLGQIISNITLQQTPPPKCLKTHPKPAAIPPYLHDRPRAVVKTCMKAYAAATYCKPEDIQRLEAAGMLFSVPSECGSGTCYTVYLGCGNIMPSCPCPAFQQTFLPCRHIFCLLRTGRAAWEDLSDEYRASPYLNLDTDTLTDTDALEAEENGNEDDSDDNGHSLDVAPHPVLNSENHLLAATRNKVLDALKQLTDLISSCQNKALVEWLDTQLQSILEEMRAAVSKENDIPLHSHHGNGQKKKGPTRMKRHGPDTMGPSPLKKLKLSSPESCESAQETSGNVVHIDPSLQFLVGNPLTFTLSSNGTELNYRGEALGIDSINTLDGNNWLDDRVVNAFLSILVDKINREDSGRIFLIPSDIPVQWAQGDFDSHLYEEVNLLVFDWIFVPVSVNKAHWVLMAVDIQNCTVNVLDSLPGGNTLDCFDHWRTFFRRRSMVMGTPAVEWGIGSLQSTQQQDGHSCGVFVLMNAMAIAKGIDIALLRPQHAHHFRKYVLCQLHAHAQSREEYLSHCEVPGCHGVGPTQRCCVICGRWAHEECCPSMCSGGSYVCVICETVYGAREIQSDVCPDDIDWHKNPVLTLYNSF